MTERTPSGDVVPAEQGTPEQRHGSQQIAHHQHRPRRTDVDPAAARRAERQVATLFGLSIVMVVLFVAGYVGIDKHATIDLWLFGTTSTMNLVLGLTFGLGTLFIGAAAIQWAKKLMPDIEVVADRHLLKSEPEVTEETIAIYEQGRDDSGFVARPIIRRSLLAAMAIFPIPLIVLLRGLWSPADGNENPGAILKKTMWADGERIVVDGTNDPIRPEDIPQGGLVNAVPASLQEVQEEEGTQNARAKAAIILVRMTPDEIRSQQGGTPEDPWDYQGILAFSKICTHVGCPISLYEQRTHHLLCPCHQSTFDLADSGVVVFGPAARRMPQLHIGVDAQGYLVARGDFAEPVGPSFWEIG
ncbi:MAG: Rieske (2Fe-2S) protein [Actinomycetota bacterium]|nr:MAG: Rieske (2Fe-2S) protein [Actinomycetota bacterium]